MLLFELLKATFSGMVEGITEWSPVLSTGYSILVQEFISLNQSKAFLDMLNIVIRLGTILATIVIYFKRLNSLQSGKTAHEVQLTWQLWLKVVIVCTPSILIVLPLDDWLEAHFNYMVPIAIALIAYGIALIWIEKRNVNVESQVTELARMPYLTVFWTGCFQVLSIIPGISRSGVTILGATIVGTSRSVAVDFTFFLAIPTMFGHNGLKAVKFFLDGNVLSFSQFLILMVASVTASLISLYVIRFLTDHVKKHDFIISGKYRIVLGSIPIVYSILKAIF